jgi:hypothetical protein
MVRVSFPEVGPAVYFTELVPSSVADPPEVPVRLTVSGGRPPAGS